MKSLPILLSILLAPALAAQEDSSQKDAPNQIQVQKIIKLVAPDGANKFHRLNLPSGQGTVVIRVKTSGDAEGTEGLLENLNFEEILGCSLEDTLLGSSNSKSCQISVECETLSKDCGEDCCGKCEEQGVAMRKFGNLPFGGSNGNPMAFAICLDGKDGQFELDGIPGDLRARIKTAIAQVGDFPLVIGGDNPHAPRAVFLSDASFGRTQGSNFLWKVDRGSATCSNSRDLWNRSAANTSCSKAAPTTCSKSSSCGPSRTLWGGTAKASCGTQPSCQTDSSCSKKSSCGNTGSKSPWNRYL